MKEEISQQRCTVGAHGYTNNLPENRASKTNVDVIDKKVNGETKLSTYTLWGDHMRDYMDRRVTPTKRVTSPTWSPSPPCKQALN